MSVLGAWSLNNSLAASIGGASLNLVSSNVALSAAGLNFASDGNDNSLAGSNNVTIAFANTAALRVTGFVAMWFNLTTGATVADQTFFRPSDPASSLNAGYYVQTNGSGVLEVNYSDAASGSSRRTWTFGTLTANTPYNFVAFLPFVDGVTTTCTGWLNSTTPTSPTASGTLSGTGVVTYPDGAQLSLGNWTRYNNARNSSHTLHKLCITNTQPTNELVAAWIADPDATMAALNSNLTIQSAPSSIVRNTAFSVTVNQPAVAPTMGGNTTARIGGATGPVCTLNSVSGTGPAYTLNFTVPTNAAIQHSSTGHPLRITIGSETVQSGNIPFTPPAGQQFVNLTSLNTGTNSVITGYTSVTPAVGAQVVMPTTTSPQSLPLTVSAAGIASHTGTLTQNNTFSYYMILADGTIGAPRTFTFAYSAAALSIISINDGEPIPNGAGELPVVMSSTAGVTGMALNGVAQAFEIVNGSILFLTNSAWPDCMYYEPIMLTVSTATDSASASTSMVPAGTNIAATADGTYNAANEGTIVGIPTPAPGSQLELQTPSSNGVGFTAGGDWRLSFDSGNPGYVWARTLDITDHTFSPWVQYPFAASSGGGGSDTTEPNIYLGGANPMTLVVGTPYSEPSGTTASDNVDGNVTSLIAITGTVNTAVPGTYTRTYTVADAAGNSRSVTRTIYVVALATDTAVGALDADISVLPPEGLARHPAAFFLGNTHLVNVAELNKARTGVLVSGATVTMLLQRNGVNVSGATWPIALTENPQVPASYYGAIPGTVSVAIGDELVLILMASAADGSLARWQHTLQVRERTI